MPASRTRADRATKEKQLTASAGDEVDEQLARYRSMRDFKVTAEPSGDAKLTPPDLPFVIQKHAATRLHYDFRLGWHGVLKSWACAKGPSYNVHDKRLAVEVEDHPMEYGGFEGIIPRGQYGGGTVMVWDQGTWTPHVDVDEGLRKGNLKFALNGTKMHGNWALVRMGGKAAHEGKPNWLLIKEHDELERPEGAPAITEEAPDSAVTGRSLEQIAEAETHVWNSKETAGTGQAWYRQRAHEADAVARPKGSPATTRTASSAESAKTTAKAGTQAVDQSIATLWKEKLPEFITPQLASEGEATPTGTSWVHELKLDGYRVQARKHGNTVQLLTRTGLDWTHRMKPVAEALQQVAADTALLDGEVVVLDDTGVSSFARLQASFEKGESHPMTYFAFDLLHLNGHSTRDLPLLERKRLLHGLLPADGYSSGSGEVRFGEHLEGDGAMIFHQACALHAEGTISKKTEATYTSGRGHAWVKSKCLHEQEFVVGGFTDLSNGTRGIGALLLGYYDEKGSLMYAGRTGTGFNARIHSMLRDKLEALQQVACPFSKIPNEAKRGAHWVQPQTVVQVRFATWTGENQLRQAAYLGLREDKPAVEVRKEDAAPKPKRAKGAAPGEEGSSVGKAAKSATMPKKPEIASKQSLPVTPTKTLPVPPVRLTHPQKVVDTESGVTKEQLAAYLWAVSPQMLPHIANRPLSLVRCPDGSAKPCFYQKHVNHMLPAGVGSVMVSDKKGGTPEPYITLNSAESLAGLAQMSVLEIHPWGSSNADLEHPNRIVIDLDPDESLPWSQVAESALEVRARLKKLGIESFVKTTGGKGLHIVFPLVPQYDFATMKAWAHGIAMAMEKDNPRLYLSKMTKAARVGKIYVDYLRNERGATAVAPFSMRSRPGLPVSVTLDWKELAEPERPNFRINNFSSEWQHRLKRDPWKKMNGLQQELSRDVVERYAGKLK